MAGKIGKAIQMGRDLLPHVGDPQTAARIRGLLEVISTDYAVVGELPEPFHPDLEAALQMIEELYKEFALN